MEILKICIILTSFHFIDTETQSRSRASCWPCSPLRVYVQMRTCMHPHHLWAVFQRSVRAFASRCGLRLWGGHRAEAVLVAQAAQAAACHAAHDIQGRADSPTPTPALEPDSLLACFKIPRLDF